jgi:hypothetical protein
MDLELEKETRKLIHKRMWKLNEKVELLEVLTEDEIDFYNQNIEIMIDYYSICLNKWGTTKKLNT